MKRIFELIKEHTIEIAYITRATTGAWGISLRKKGNITSRSISGYELLSDEDIEVIYSMGIRVFDFLKTEDFSALFKSMEETHRIQCL